jgi:hypothetical protein
VHTLTRNSRGFRVAERVQNGRTWDRTRLRPGRLGTALGDFRLRFQGFPALRAVG